MSAQNGKYCLCLKNSLCGLSVAPHLWYQHLFSALWEMGFDVSAIDPCVMISPDKGIIVVFHVDNGCLGYQEQSTIDWFKSEFEGQWFELTIEGTLANFLGLKHECSANGSITVTHKGLIKKIITATKMEVCNPTWLPCTRKPLEADDNGEPMKKNGATHLSWDGSLLATNMQPDISCHVSQAACYSANPKKCHATAVKMVVHYLKRTPDKGIIMHPNGTMGLDCYVDANFASMYGVSPSSNPASVKS